MKRWVLVMLVLIVVVQIVMLYSIKVLSDNEGQLFRFTIKNPENEKVTNDKEDLGNSESESVSDLSSNSFNSSNGGSGGSSGDLKVVCYEQQISYSLTRIEDENLTSCILRIKNLDYEFKGEFIVSFSLLDSNQEILKNETVIMVLGPREEGIFQSELISPTWTDCEYRTIKIPKKQVCQ